MSSEWLKEKMGCGREAQISKAEDALRTGQVRIGDWFRDGELVNFGDLYPAVAKQIYVPESVVKEVGGGLFGIVSEMFSELYVTRAFVTGQEVLKNGEVVGRTKGGWIVARPWDVSEEERRAWIERKERGF